MTTIKNTFDAMYNSGQTLDNISASLPEGFTGEQVGEMLYVQGAPSMQHQRAIIYTLGSLMARYHETWEFSFNTRLDIRVASGHHNAPTGYFQPDMIGWLRSSLYNDELTTLQNTRPSWVCEVQSTNADYDWGVKKPTYEAMGIPWLWMINPNNRSFTAFELTNGQYTTIATEKYESAMPFVGWPIDYTRMFSIRGGR